MDTLHRNLRTALRKLRRSPLFTSLAIFTLALGIGANSAIFSVVDSVLIQPLPYPEADRLVGVWYTAPGIGIEEMTHSESTYLLTREHQRVFEDLGIYQEQSATLTGDGDPVRLESASVTPSLFPVLGIEPTLGRGFLEEEGSPGTEPVVLLSHGLWNRRFGARSDLLGETVLIEGVHRRVVGIMPADFRFPRPETDLWTPLVIDPADLRMGDFNYTGIARLLPGITPEDATKEVTALVHRLPELFPDSPITAGMLEQARLTGDVHPLSEDVVGDVGPVLWTLLASVGVILLIACANVANLFLVRTEGRQQELAVRSALGAGRGQLALGFFTESVVLSLSAGALGLGLAWFGLRALVNYGVQDLPRLAELGISSNGLTFTLALAVASGFLFGLLPALKGTPDPGTALKEGARGSTGGLLSQRARAGLVVAQRAPSREKCRVRRGFPLTFPLPLTSQ